jgi:hypothetical protein
MSAEIWRFTWGDPDNTQGWRDHDEHWYYVGNSMSLAATGKQSGSLDNKVDMHLVDGRVASWNDFVPDSTDDLGTGGSQERRERHSKGYFMRPGHRR